MVSLVVPLGAFYLWCDYVSTYPLQFANSWSGGDNITRTVSRVLGKIQNFFKVIGDHEEVTGLKSTVPTLEQQLLSKIVAVLEKQKIEIMEQKRCSESKILEFIEKQKFEIAEVRLELERKKTSSKSTSKNSTRAVSPQTLASAPLQIERNLDLISESKPSASVESSSSELASISD